MKEIIKKIKSVILASIGKDTSVDQQILDSLEDTKRTLISQEKI